MKESGVSSGASENDNTCQPQMGGVVMLFEGKTSQHYLSMTAAKRWWWLEAQYGRGR